MIMQFYLLKEMIIYGIHFLYTSKDEVMKLFRNSDLTEKSGAL